MGKFVWPLNFIHSCSQRVIPVEPSEKHPVYQFAYERKPDDYHKKLQIQQMPWLQAYFVSHGDEKTLSGEFYINAFSAYLVPDGHYCIKRCIVADHGELAAAFINL
jgi:hypothetical protein